MSVFVLDRRKKPLMPCSEKRARLLLQRGRARVHRLRPFTIRLADLDQRESILQPLALKLDPGAKTTGVALVRVEATNDSPTHHVVHLAEIAHRGSAIRDTMRRRAAYRRRRRGANLRYRPSRFDNRTKPEGWLPPSLRHRIETIVSWVARYRRFTPITGLAMELVRFDTHAMSSPDVAEVGGAAYQQGELAGYEIREYLLEKWGRCCAYCDRKNVPLQIEHIVSRARGGSDRISNLTLACEGCNQRKGAMPIEVFLAGDPLRLARIAAQAKKPLRDAAAMNATRWQLWRALRATGLPVECGSGGRTKWNRSRFGIPKEHCLDAAAVGDVAAVHGWDAPVLMMNCTGRGEYQRTSPDAYGFPRLRRMRSKSVRGFRSGDLVRAAVLKGKHAGVWTGRVAVRASGSFAIYARDGRRDGINVGLFSVLQRADGYEYLCRANARPAIPPGPEGPGFSRRSR
jgi:5-methylcytosine-specific restriction endonuclease McrA